jgi:Ni/Fe-hydrogenase 1 B-type cytochrome subunit
MSVLARLIWMVLGPRRSSWRNFLPVSRRRQIDLWKTFKFYTMRSPTPPTTIGHNPLAGLSYVGVFSLYCLMIATGFALYSASTQGYMHMWSFLVPVLHGVQGARWLHHVTTWVLIVFVIAHMFLTSLTSRSEKNGVVDSMVSGYKFLPKGTPPDDQMTP